MVEVLLCSDLCSHRSLWRFTERLTGQQSTTNGNQRRGWLPSVGFSLYPSLKYILFFFSCPSFFSPLSSPLPAPPSLSLLSSFPLGADSSICTSTRSPGPSPGLPCWVSPHWKKLRTLNSSTCVQGSLRHSQTCPLCLSAIATHLTPAAFRE